MPVTVSKYDSKVVAKRLIHWNLMVTFPDDPAWPSRGVVRAPQQDPASDRVKASLH